MASQESYVLAEPVGDGEGSFAPPPTGEPEARGARGRQARIVRLLRAVIQRAHTEGVELGTALEVALRSAYNERVCPEGEWMVQGRPDRRSRTAQAHIRTVGGAVRDLARLAEDERAAQASRPRSVPT